MSAPQDVASAKVSRSAAVWVAIITAVGGFATALATGSLGLFSKHKTVVLQHWIRIETVQLETQPSLPVIDRIRLIAQVNGVSYSYPTTVNSIWAPVGPGMVGERYPLPIGAETYRVRFYAFGYTLDGKTIHYESRDVAEFLSRQIPLRGASQGLQLGGSSPSGLATGMTVRYSIE